MSPPPGDLPAGVGTELVRGVPVRCYADRPTSLVALLQQALARTPDALLLLDPARDEAVTYAQFAAHVEGAAAALTARGLVPGDRVALLAANGLEAAVGIWACARAGLVHLGLPVDAPPARLAALLALTSPALVLVQPALRPLAEQAGAPGPEDAAAVLLGAPRPWDPGRPLPDQDDTYMLIPTSGTTGAPKAVRITGRMAGHAARCYVDALALTADDRTAIHLPFAWVSGSLTQLAPAMLSGGSAVTMAEFSAAELVRTAAEHRVTWLDVVPSIWELLLREAGFGVGLLAHVRLAVFGGAPAPPGTLDRVRERLPQIALVDVYALSETCAPVTVLPDAAARTHPGSVGQVVPYAELRLVDADGAVVPAGQVGEVQVRSAAVTPGYWGQAEVLALTADGFLRTGDLARLDADGFLHVSGRSVDLIIRGGVNVYPAEVERALLATGLLADAAAVGLPHALFGQAVAAGVVALPGTAPDAAVLQRAVAAAVGAHAVPRPLRVLADLPRGRNGKVDRPALAAQLRDPSPS